MEIKPMFADKIAEWIKFKNEDRGPYGLRLTIVAVKKRMGRAPLITLEAHVVDRGGETMWPALQQALIIELVAGNTLTLTDLAAAFKFSYSTQGVF